jgi:hypothetical protein
VFQKIIIIKTKVKLLNILSLKIIKYILNMTMKKIYVILWAPFLITAALTIDSLYYLTVVFDEIFFIPDFYVLELLFFTLMIPIVYWHKNKWIKINAIHKKLFIIILILSIANFVKYVFVIVFSFLNIMKNIN